MKSPKSININLGISSILLIFFVLSMVSFAVLSLSSALSDKKLTEKTVLKNTTYYDACNRMQYMLADLDKEYMDYYADSSSEQEYINACTASTTLTVDVSEYQQLVVTVTPTYPVNDDDHLYEIESWKLVYNHEPDIDFSIPVIK